MFRVSLLEFFTRALSSENTIMPLSDGPYILEWISFMRVPADDNSGRLEITRGFRFRQGGGYRAFKATFELDMLRIAFIDQRLVELITGIGELRSISDGGENPRQYISFPNLLALLRYGLGGITMIITPIEPPIVRTSGY